MAESVYPQATKALAQKRRELAPEAELLERIPYGRIADVEDVAWAAVWLASDEADYITGTTVHVDGGMMLYPGFMGHG